MTVWGSLCHDDTFNQFYATYADRCTRATHRAYRHVALQWHISSDDYRDMVTSAVGHAFHMARTDLDTPDARQALGWLIVCARRHLLRDLKDLLEYWARHANLEDMPDRATTDITTAFDIAHLLHHLPFRQALVLQRCSIEGFSPREVAQATATTEAAVKSTLQRARCTFRLLWREGGCR